MLIHIKLAHFTLNFCNDKIRFKEIKSDNKRYTHYFEFFYSFCN